MTRLGIIIVIILATGVIFYTNYDRPAPPWEKSSVVEKDKGPWKFLHCTPTNKDCGKLEQPQN